MQDFDLSCLKFAGEGSRVYPFARLIRPENISLGAESQIDDFVLINGGKSTVIGKRVHIASFTSIIGGGEFQIEDYAGLSAGVRIVTGTDKHDGSSLTNPCIPSEFRSVDLGKVVIKRHALIFSNCVILPNVTVGEGAVVGAGAVVHRDLEPWSIYAGHGCRKVAERDSSEILKLEKQLIEKYGY